MCRVLLYVSLFVLALPQFASAEEAYGTLSVVKGNVQIQGKDKQLRPAQVGAKILPGETIITAADSRAKITMVDKNVMNVSPDTKMVIENYEFKPDENKKNVTLNVLFGKVRSSVEQKYDGEQNKFHVKTPSAVAGVRGTDFLVSQGKTETSSKIVTFSGQVEVGSKLGPSGKIENPVQVNPGQFTVASKNAPPAPPAAVPPAELNSMKRETQAEPAKDGGGGGNSSQNDSNKKGNGSSTSGDKDKSSGGDKDKGGDKNGGTGGNRTPASTGPGPGGMAPTMADMTNTSPTGDTTRPPDPLGMIIGPLPIQPVSTPQVNPDIISGTNTKLSVTVH